jgi:hypothetical protein
MKLHYYVVGPWLRVGEWRHTNDARFSKIRSKNIITGMNLAGFPLRDFIQEAWKILEGVVPPHNAETLLGTERGAISCKRGVK